MALVERRAENGIRADADPGLADVGLSASVAVIASRTIGLGGPVGGRDRGRTDLTSVGGVNRPGGIDNAADGALLRLRKPARDGQAQQANLKTLEANGTIYHKVSEVPKGLLAIRYVRLFFSE